MVEDDDWLPVSAFCAYPGSAVMKESRDSLDGAQWSAKKFVDAVKGRALNGTGSIPVGTGHRRLDARSRSRVFEWFAVWASGQAVWRTGRCLICPVPASAVVRLEELDASAPGKLAQAIVDILGPEAVALGRLLRFNRPVAKTSKGGSRNAMTIYENLRTAVDWTDDAESVVLVDDVMTTGAHFRACEAALRHSGFRVVAALCAAHTFTEPVDKPFSVPDTILRRMPDRDFQ